MEAITIGRLVHLVGLALGLGGALAIDILVLASLDRPIGATEVHIIEKLAKITQAGFALLVTSGIGFLMIYAALSPEKLANPKLWAKLVVVGVLGLNSRLVHRWVLPHLRAHIGTTLFEGMAPLRRDGLLLVGTISFISWMAATALGTIRELNFATSSQTILSFYALAILAAALLAMILIRLRDDLLAFTARSSGAHASAQSRS